MLPEAVKNKPELIWARRLVWLYFWLLIFEGALRKWWLPEYSTPLLLIRDPLVILIYMLAGARGAFPKQGFIVASCFLAVATAISSLAVGHSNFLITLYGVRTNFLHLPLIFVISRLFSLDDVWRFGRVWMWLSLPMGALIVAQFLAPYTSVVNYAAGGVAGQIMGVMGHVRPAGTFSFITGVATFLSVQVAFILAAFFQKRDRWLRLFSLVALIISLACSVSRLAVLSSVLVGAFAVWMMFIQPSRFSRGLIMLSAGAVALFILAQTPIYKYGAEVLSSRFQQAAWDSGDESATDNLGKRIANDLTNPLALYKTVSAFGEGTGMGTNVAANLLTGRSQFLLAELEWSRLLWESGYVLGTFLIGLRIALTGFLFFWGWKCLKNENLLPWLLFASIFPLVLNGAWGQPTTLGFACLISGLLLAATRPSFESHPLLNKAALSIPRS